MPSRELQVGDLCAIPAGVFDGAFQGGQLSEAGFEDESFFFALPQEIFILFGERTQVFVFLGFEVEDLIRIVLDSFAVGQQSGPHGGPGGVEYFSLGNVGAEWSEGYSKTQSSYWSI